MMPKRFAVGTNLRFRLARAFRWAISADVQPTVAFSGLSSDPRIEGLESRTLLSNTWFVATHGNDSASGTLAQPFKTIQAAANIAQRGDTVEIEAGTYRESIHPAHSGVTFTNYNNQTVTITGTDQVTGWSNNGGAVYKASMPWDLGEGSNQVFVDGQPVNEARWPNSSPDLLHPAEATVGGYSNGALYDPSITQGNGFWAGATITITPGDGWVSYTGIVNNSGPGWLQVSLPATGISQVETPVAGNSYFLSGKFQALDAPGEWYRDASGTLCLWDPASDNPAGHDIEVKHRQYGFDLSGVSNTTVQGINLFACTIHTDWASTGTTINYVTAAYVTQFNNLWGSGWAPAGPYGVELNGANSIIENSTIAFSAGDGVYVNAPNVRVTHNVIHDVDASGTDAAGVRVFGAGAMIDHNTIYNTGRDGINLASASTQVLNNVIHDFMLLTYDGAAIYAQRVNGQGSPIAYNTIYNAHKNNYGGLDACGIMLDNDASGFVVHDNVTANVDAGLKANNTSYNEQIYSNQFGATQYAIESNGWPGFAYSWWGTQLHDNVFYNGNLKLGSSVSQWNNAYASGSPALNVAATAGSPIPTLEPVVPASSSGGNVGASGSTASAQPPVSGAIQGRFLATRRTTKRAATYRLNAKATIAGMGAVRITGVAIGAIVKGSATGTLRIANARGAVTLSLTVPAQTNSMPTPSAFEYTVAHTTGAYKKLSGSGILNLAFTPTNKKGTAGTFQLVLAGGRSALS
jgi:hypothetical protein